MNNKQSKNTFEEFFIEKERLEELITNEVNNFINKYNLQEVNVGKQEPNMHHLFTNGGEPFNPFYRLEVIL